MPILKGDVKLLKSEVMDDVDEGGGPPTSLIVGDGVSNAIFPDISETDRAAGRVNARKLHVWVQSDDRDAYLGPSVIVAEPPNDPNVSITLFTTGDVFDRRTSAISRVESYLNRGAAYPGVLYGDMIEGQAVITVFQRTSDLPAIGDTLALTKRQGFPNESTQYVRITDGRASLRTFTDQTGDYQRWVIELKLSDPLRADFQGFGASRFDPTPEELALRTRVFGTVVADAAKYAGVTKLQVAAALGDFTIKGASIFSQLVPSAQIETAIGDARTNQLASGMIAAGAPITRSINSFFSPVQSLFVGGGIAPGSLRVTDGALQLEDLGGTLVAGGAQVGNVDYENGILSLQTAIYGLGGVALTVTYQPAQAIQAVTQSQGFKITAGNRALSYVQTIEPPPVPGSTLLSYRVARQWYTLRDQGDGKLRGVDSSYGAGRVDPVTGTLVATLGALPDVGSEIIIQWIEPIGAVNAEQLKLDNDGKVYWSANVDGVLGDEPGSRSIEPGALVLLWKDTPTGEQRQASDDGQGGIVGDATGRVNYARGTFRVSPKLLPAPGTTVTINTETRAIAGFAGQPVTAGAGNLGFTNIRPGTISFSVTPTVKLKYENEALVDGPEASPRPVFDDGQGRLLMATGNDGAGYGIPGALLGPTIQIGTVNYQTGDFQLAGTITLPTASPALLPFMQFENYFLRATRPVMQLLTLAN